MYRRECINTLKYRLKALQIVSRLHTALCSRVFHDEGMKSVLYDKEVMCRVFQTILKDNEETHHQQVGINTFTQFV